MWSADAGLKRKGRGDDDRWQRAGLKWGDQSNGVINSPVEAQGRQKRGNNSDELINTEGFMLILYFVATRDTN